MFFTSAPCSCVSLRDFVKLIVGAFFYFFNKNELEKKIRCQLPARRRWQSKCATAVLIDCLPLAKSLRGLLLDKPWKCLLKTKKRWQKQREKMSEMSCISIGYVPLGLFALKDEQVLVYVNKPFNHQTAMPVSSTANSVLWQKQKQTKKKKYIQLTRSWCHGVLFLTAFPPPPLPAKASAELCSEGLRDTGGTQGWEATLRRRLSPRRSLGEAKRGRQTGSNIITWELFRNADSWGSTLSQILRVGPNGLFQPALQVTSVHAQV